MWWQAIATSTNIDIMNREQPPCVGSTVVAIEATVNMSRGRFLFPCRGFYFFRTDAAIFGVNFTTIRHGQFPLLPTGGYKRAITNKSGIVTTAVGIATNVRNNGVDVCPPESVLLHRLR